MHHIGHSCVPTNHNHGLPHHDGGTTAILLTAQGVTTNHVSQRQSLMQTSVGPSKPELASKSGLAAVDDRVRNSADWWEVSAQTAPPVLTARETWTDFDRVTATTAIRQRQVDVRWQLAGCRESAFFTRAAQHGDRLLVGSAGTRWQQDAVAARAARRVQQQSRDAHDGQTIRTASSAVSNLLECTVPGMGRWP